MSGIPEHSPSELLYFLSKHVVPHKRSFGPTRSELASGLDRMRILINFSILSRFRMHGSICLFCIYQCEKNPFIFVSRSGITLSDFFFFLTYYLFMTYLLIESFSPSLFSFRSLVSKNDSIRPFFKQCVRFTATRTCLLTSLRWPR